MPIYDFKCPSCGASFDALTKLGTTHIPCRVCGTDANKQVSAPGGFDLKGDGWYKPSSTAPVKD